MILWNSWAKIYLAIVLRIVYGKIEHEWNKPAKITQSKCTNEICTKEGEDIVLSMNRGVNPCEDFYEYVCGNWPKIHVDPNRQYRRFPLNFETILEYKSYSDLRESLEEPIDWSDHSDEKKAKALYAECMKLPWMKKLPAKELEPIISFAGDWPMFPSKSNSEMLNLQWTTIDNYYLKLTGESALYAVFPTINPVDTKKPIIELRKIGSPYGLFSRNADWRSVEMHNYKQFLEAIASSVKPGNTIDIPEARFLKYLTNVIEFRIKLQNIIHSAKRQPLCTMTIAYLEQWYNEQGSALIHSTTIPWLKAFQSLYMNVTDRIINGKTEILLGYPEYFTQLRILMQKTPTHTIANHIHLYFIERHLLLTAAEEELLYSSIDMTTQKPVANFRVFPEKWYMCIEKHTMQSTLGKMYIREHMSLAGRERVKQMIEEVKEVTSIQITDSAWLNKETKKLTTFKIEKIKSSVGYPEWYDQTSLKKKFEGIYTYPHRPNAEYVHDMNRIFINAAYLQTPMFNTFLPFALNYGSLGSLIGHEIYHALDNIGIWYNYAGKRTAWWPQKMNKIYETQKTCFVEQYREYTIKELEKLNDVPDKKKPEITLEEDIADSMGLKASYEAYRRKLMEGSYICPVLPQLTSYTCDELFFISFGRSFCYAGKPKQILHNIRYDEHNTARIRVNGAVSNMKEFSQAFRCAKSARLNRKHKCDIWE